jgi:putative ABC transport system ATP-binding protein
MPHSREANDLILSGPAGPNRPEPATAEAPAIDLHDVQLTLSSGAGGVNILRGLKLQVAPGEAVAVVGPSGAGKTTMLMIIAGLERPNSGRVRIAGTDLGALNEDQQALFRRTHIGIVFQAFHLIPTMTALENVAVPLEIAGRADAFARARAELDAVELGHRLPPYPGQLSGGAQQPVALARALVSRPRILLADEPTGNLDRETGEAMIDLLFNLHRERGTALLLITHNPSLAARCDRFVELIGGRIRSRQP